MDILMKEVLFQH